MRVAFAGKGGSGKSVIAGTVARLLARQGQPVLAVDVDTLPGLSLSMGLGLVPDAGLPADLAEKVEGKGWVLKEEVSAEELVDRHALEAPDGIRFLQLGKLPGPVWARVPYDERVAKAEREGRALVDEAEDGPALAAIGGLVGRLLAEEAEAG